MPDPFFKNTGRLTKNGTTIMVPLEEDVSYGKARGYEQAYIEHYDTKKGVVGTDISQANRGNKINSFDVNNTTRDKLRQKSFADARDQKLKKLNGAC